MPVRRMRWTAGLALLIAGIGLFAWWWQLRDSPPARVPGAIDYDPGHPYPQFGPDDVFAVDISAAPVAANSPAMIINLLGQITPHYGGVAALNTSAYNPSLYVVDANTPRVDVAFHDCQKKGHTPAGLLDGPAHFRDVPIPPQAQPARGKDASLTLWSPSTDQLWEFWMMRRRGSGWEACWGGRIDQLSTGPGYFPPPYGVSASGLVSVGSMITLREAAELRIDHAIGLGIIAPATWERVNYPANRSDGYDNSPNAIPEGSRLRLDPSVDVDSLGLTPLATAIARAAQTYGFIVVDKGGAVAVVAESSLPVRQRSGTDPWPRLLRGTPNYLQLKDFPWDRLQVIAPDYGKPSG